MTRYLLDTGIAGHFVNNRRGVRPRALAELRRGNRIGIGVPVLAELYFGVEYSATRDRNLQRLRSALGYLTVWPFTDDAAERYGQIAADLRRAGRTIQQIDMMIAAIALTLGNTIVVSADSDLSAVPGLAVENWAGP